MGEGEAPVEVPHTEPGKAGGAHTVGLGGRGRGSAGEEALNGAHEGVQRTRGAGVVLAEVGRGEAADEAIDAGAKKGGRLRRSGHVRLHTTRPRKELRMADVKDQESSQENLSTGVDPDL
jgi:hypothetical protein